MKEEYVIKTGSSDEIRQCSFSIYKSQQTEHTTGISIPFPPHHLQTEGKNYQQGRRPQQLVSARVG